MSIAVPLVTSLVALVFAIAVLDQYLERRRPYQLVWTVSLFLWFVASGAQFLWEATGHYSVVFRFWYLAGAVLVPAYMGTGTVYLLAPRRVADVAMVALLAVTVVAEVLVLTVPLQFPLGTLEGKALTGRGFFPGYVTSLTILLNTYGTIALVGGAVWSGWTFWRHREKTHRVVSNTLIAIGVLVAAAGGTFARLGVPEPHSFALLAGVVIIYIGFLRSREVFAQYRVPFVRRFREV